MLREILLLLQECEIEQKGIKNKKIIGKKNGELAFVIEKNPKNQFKETIHIFLNQGHILSDEIEYPELVGNRKELVSGRLLHYVSFNGGKTKLDKRELLNLIQKPF